MLLGKRDGEILGLADGSDDGLDDGLSEGDEDGKKLVVGAGVGAEHVESLSHS